MGQASPGSPCTPPSPGLCKGLLPSLLPPASATRPHPTLTHPRSRSHLEADKVADPSGPGPGRRALLSGGCAGGEQGAAQLGGWQETKSGGSRGHLAHREAGVSDMLPCSHSLDHPYFLRVCPPAKRLAHPGDRTAGGHDSSGQGRIIIHKHSRSEAPGGRGLGETTLPSTSSPKPCCRPGPHPSQGGVGPQAPAAPCQPLCFRLGLGLSKADSPDETRASPATSPPACKVSGLHWGQRTTQKPSWSRAGGQSCRAGFPESEQPARRAPCPCPAEPRTSGQSRTESLIHSKSCSSLDSGDTQ